MSKSTNQARGSFKELLGEEVKTPIQKVHPTKIEVLTPQEKDETQLMVWIPTDLMVKIKTKTVREKKSMKEIVTEILEKSI